jgi:hypothetical protein
MTATATLPLPRVPDPPIRKTPVGIDSPDEGADVVVVDSVVVVVVVVVEEVVVVEQ